MISELGQPIGEPVQGWRPRPSRSGAVLSGRYCRLEPLTRRHVPSLHDALNVRDRSGRQWTYMPWGPFRDVDEFAAFIDALVAEPGFLTLAVIDSRTGEPEGMAGWARIDPAMGSIEVGGVIYRPTLSERPGWALLAAYSSVVSVDTPEELEVAQVRRPGSRPGATGDAARGPGGRHDG